MKYPCKHPRCAALLDARGYCEKHAASAPNSSRDYDQGRRRNDPALAQAAAIRSSWRWKKVSGQKRRGWPLCEDPFGDHERRGTTETTKQIHHIKGLKDHPELAYDLDNLMSVCTTCHSKLERALVAQLAEDDSNAPQATIIGNAGNHPLFG